VRDGWNWLKMDSITDFSVSGVESSDSVVKKLTSHRAQFP
jgi:hypothetical protein